MSKTKTPFLSMGASGTVGGSLTSQKRGSATLLREKPIPTDPYTLAQAYQRWDYKDYAYLWTLLSLAQKQVYQTAASRYHITGFSLWMREQLKTLPDILGRWHLDEKAGAVAYDSSKNANNGTIIGASPAAGIIDGAYSFDGLNDYINCGNDPSLAVTSDFSLETFIYSHDLASDRVIVDRNFINNFLWRTEHPGVQKLYIRLTNGLYESKLSTTPLTPYHWHHIAVVWDNSTKTILFYLDGNPDGGGVLTLPIRPTGWQDFYIGAFQANTQWLHALVDELHYCNRTLDTTEINRHSERRYP